MKKDIEIGIECLDCVQWKQWDGENLICQDCQKQRQERLERDL